MKTNKLRRNLEIMQALQFLGIPTENYRQLKAKYGSAEKLHAALAKMLCA